MLRPSLHDPDLLRAAAQALLPRLQDMGPPDEVGEDLLAALKHTAPEFDGFEITAYLKDRRGWAVDGMLVELLNEAFTEVLFVQENAVQAWVVREHIVPRKQLGDTAPVTVKGVLHTGTIARVDTRNATYVVAVPALGHGVPDSLGGTTHGVVVPFEALHTILTPPDEFQLTMQ